MRSKSILVVVMLVLLFGFASISFATVASFQGLGYLPSTQPCSEAWDVSADGSVVVGRSGYCLSQIDFEAFRWTRSGGMVGLGVIQSSAKAVSADGSVIVGYKSNGSQAFRWTESGGMQGLVGGRWAADISADGSVIVGYKSDGEAFRWTESGGMQGLGSLGSSASGATSVSADGSVVVGWGDFTPAQGEAFRWTESTGMQGLGDLPGGEYWSGATGVSADGTVVVGAGNSAVGLEAFHWTESGGMVGIGCLPGWTQSEAYGVSADGLVVVGMCYSGSQQFGEAFIWDERNGMRSVQELLVSEHKLDLTGWTLRSAEAISDDCLTIVGTAWKGNPWDEKMEGWIATISESITTPPDANANGPYSIYVGDTLTLDANGSTDADDDIVSYLWDLDDDENFETDAGGQAVFTVDYAYLESLELLINHQYTIHLKVTDSEGQSDTADSTFIIVPKPAVKVAVDIKPGGCPNPVNVKSSGVLPVAILGTEDVNVLDIVPTSVEFSFGDVRVGAIRNAYEDVAGPVGDSNDCNCIEAGPDGFLDLTLKFKTQRIVEAIGDVNDGDVLTLQLTGVLYDPPPYERPIEGADCILIKGKHKTHNKADINKDGVVNSADFAIIAQNWLQSTED